MRHVRRLSRKAVTEIILKPVFCGDNGADDEDRRDHNRLAGIQPKREDE